jgi:hypothetical protein
MFAFILGICKHVVVIVRRLLSSSSIVAIGIGAPQRRNRNSSDRHTFCPHLSHKNSGGTPKNTTRALGGGGLGLSSRADGPTSRYDDSDSDDSDDE